MSRYGSVEAADVTHSADGGVVINKSYFLPSPEILPIDVLVKHGHERAGLENLVKAGKVRSIRIGRKLCIVVRDLVDLATKEPRATKVLSTSKPFRLADSLAHRGPR